MWALLRLGDVIGVPVGWGVQAGGTSQAKSVHLVAFSPRWLRAELWERQEQTSGCLQSARSLHSLRAIPPKVFNGPGFPYPLVFAPYPSTSAPRPVGPTVISALLMEADLMAGFSLFRLKFSPPGGLCLHFVPGGGGGRMASRAGSW